MGSDDLPDVEILSVLGTLKINQRREQQDHVASFVHDGSPTVGTADLAGKFVHTGLLTTLVPAQVVVTMSEIDVIFVEDSSPLKWGTWI